MEVIMDLSLLLPHSLRYGALLSAGLSALILGSLYANAEMWLADYPPDIREKYGPMSERTKKQRTLFTIPFVLFLVGVVALSIVRLGDVLGDVTFTAVFLHTFIMLELFNLVDLLIIDWLVLGLMRPKFAILPGTEGMAGYNSYGFAFQGFVKGTIGLFIGALLIAALAMWLL
jgi:hypothetical protein